MVWKDVCVCVCVCVCVLGSKGRADRGMRKLRREGSIGSRGTRLTASVVVTVQHIIG